MNRILLLLMIAGLASGCRKPLPSPDFIEASGRYTNLLALNGDDAYGTAEMAAVVTQLGRVTEKSSDFAAATALVTKIAAETTRAAADKEARDKLAHPPVAPPNFPTLAVAVQEPEPIVPVVKKEPEDPYAVVIGAAWPPLATRFVGCIVPRGPLTLTRPDGGEAKQTEMFELADKPDCRQRIPALVANLSVVYEGKILNILPKGAVASTTVINQAAQQPAPVPAPPPAAVPQAVPTAPAPPAQDPVLAPIKY